MPNEVEIAKETEELETAESTEQVETEESAESAAAETTETSESEHEEPKPRKGGVQRRIDELTRKSHLAEAEKDFWKQKALGTKPEETKAEVKTTAEPKPENFATVEQYLTAVRAYDREQLRAEMRSEVEKLSQKEAERAEASELQAGWSQHEAEVTKAHEDYQEVTQAALDTLADVEGPAKAALAHAIQYSDAGPELLYHLGQHPEIVEELAVMHPTRAVVALGRLEGSLAKDSGDKATPHTKAPKPPTPVRSGKASDPNDLSDSVPMDKWLKNFNKRMENKARA